MIFLCVFLGRERKEIKKKTKKNARGFVHVGSDAQFEQLVIVCEKHSQQVHRSGLFAFTLDREARHRYTFVWLAHYS